MARKQVRKVPMIGRVFFRLTVLSEAGKLGKHIAFLCACVCGMTKVIAGTALRAGSATSCGCYQRERAIEAHFKHGMTGSVEYEIWAGIRNRCRNLNNQAYPKYGGRGITICERWNEFEKFYADMGPRPSNRHSIDRIDNDGGYCPENCRWATREEQIWNRRDTKFFEYDGRRMAIAAWAKEFGIRPTVVAERIRKGWDILRALSTPIKAHKPYQNSATSK